MSNSPDFPKTTDLHGEKLPQSWNLSTTRPEDQPHENLEIKLAMSVSKVLGVTPLVKSLDKEKALHKENSKNKFYQNKYKDTLACVQT